jgi:hypothetical protein
LIVNNTLKLSNIDLEYFKNFKFKVKYILKFNSLVK